MILVFLYKTVLISYDIFSRQEVECSQSKPDSLTVVELKEQLAKLQSSLDAEQQKKEACQNEITRLSKQLQIAKDKMNLLPSKSRHSVSVSTMEDIDGYCKSRETITSIQPFSVQQICTPIHATGSSNNTTSGHMIESLYDLPNVSTACRLPCHLANSPFQNRTKYKGTL